MLRHRRIGDDLALVALEAELCLVNQQNFPVSLICPNLFSFCINPANNLKQRRPTQLARGTHLNAHKRLLTARRPFLHHGEGHGRRNGDLHPCDRGAVLVVQLLDAGEGEE